MHREPFSWRRILSIFVCAVFAIVSASAPPLLSQASVAVPHATGLHAFSSSLGTHPPEGQSANANYPTLTADQMRDLVISSHDIGLMMRLLQIRDHPEQLSTALALGASTNLLKSLPGGSTLRIPGEPLWTEGDRGAYSNGGQALMTTGNDGRLVWYPLPSERSAVRVLCVRPYRWWLAGHAVAQALPQIQQNANGAPGGSPGDASANSEEGPGCRERMLTAVGLGQVVAVQVQFVNDTKFERKLYRIDGMGFKHSSGSVNPHSTSRPINGLAGQVWLVEDQNKKCTMKFRAESSQTISLEK